MESDLANDNVSHGAHVCDLQMMTAKWIVRYLKGTLSYGIRFRKWQCFPWFSKMKEIVAQLTVEEEFTASRASITETLALKKIDWFAYIDRRKN